MLQSHVVNQFQNQNRFAYASAAEKANLAAFDVGLHQVNDFDTRLEHLESGGLIFKLGSRAMNRIVLVADDRSELVDRLTQNVHDTAEGSAANRHGDPHACVVSLHAAHHAFGGLHGDRADAALAQMLLHFDDHVERLGNVVTFAGNADSVKNSREMPALKLNVQHRSDDLYDVSDCYSFLCHAFSYFP